MISKIKDELINRINYIEEKEYKDLIISAIEFCCAEEDIDHNGTSYKEHNLRVAIILTELHSDYITIVAALVAWTIRNGEELKEKILNTFGEVVYEICLCLEKITKLNLKGNLEDQAIYSRKIIVGLSTDVRVIVIMLARRLDNLKYVYTEPSLERKNKCIETEHVLIPIAHRLGINYIKSELEDLCLKYLNPDAYNEILSYLDASYDELNRYIEEMKNDLSDILIRNNIDFRIKGRVKSVHSLHEKLSKGRKWNDIYDVLALRIIVEKTSECYAVMGLIHAKYRPIPKRFKDFIAQPKENMYQSLHTGVIGPDGRIFEIQIRTEEMDEIAECGLASHWSYKEHGTKAIQNLMEQKLELFREALEMTNDDEKVINDFKETFANPMIYVFTPKGDVVELPEESTPVDFAYRIHSHIGDTMVSAIVNDEIVPLDYKLKNDDIIKIKTNENSTPNKDWLKFVVTTQAKSRIKTFFSKQDRSDYIERGYDLIIKEIKKRHWNVQETLSEENLNKLVKILKLNDVEDIYLSVGSQRYTSKYVMSLLTEERQNISDLILEKITTRNSQNAHNHKDDVIIEGCENILVNFANCCKPIYGDEIVGYITKGNGIIVHKSNCHNLENMDARFIDVKWNDQSDNSYSARIVVKTNSLENNILALVTKSSQKNMPIESINSKELETGISYEIMVKVPNIEKLKMFMLDLESLPFVIDVSRKVK